MYPLSAHTLDFIARLSQWTERRGEVAKRGMALARCPTARALGLVHKTFGRVPPRAFFFPLPQKPVWTPIPSTGVMKYVLVSGGVISGVGKVRRCAAACTFDQD
jgi:hypothetical protein